MSPSEIAFLALGIVLGAAIGAAIVEAVRSRPVPRREVRVTIAPNSVLPRRSATLAAAVAGASGRRMPGSPEDEAWREGHAASFLAAAALGRRSSGMSILDRTRVLSGAPVLPSTAVAVPVDRPARRDPAPDGGVAPLSPLIPGIAGGQAGGGVPARPFARPRSRARPAPRHRARRHPPVRDRPNPVPWIPTPPRRRAARSARSRCSRRWPRRTTSRAPGGEWEPKPCAAGRRSASPTSAHRPRRRRSRGLRPPWRRS